MDYTQNTRDEQIATVKMHIVWDHEANFISDNEVLNPYRVVQFLGNELQT